MIHASNSLTGNDDPQVHKELRDALVGWFERLNRRWGQSVKVEGVVGQVRVTLITRSTNPESEGALAAHPVAIDLFGEWGMADDG